MTDQQILTNKVYLWGHSRRFHSYTENMRKTFGGRIQKVVVDAGFTCPNRDGSKGSGGCTYCDNNAFNPSYCNPKEPIQKQIAKGIEFHAVRYRRAEKFLVYFQPYSNTYATLDTLKNLYAQALDYPRVAGLVIGTRPDCVDNDILDYLGELSKKTFIQVEYGVESSHNTTLERINRQHNCQLSETVIKNTRARGIHTGIHLIFGLPGETTNDMFHTVDTVSALPINSIKFHQLQIVKGTAMEKEFLASPGDFHLFRLEGYISFIVSVLEKMNPAIVIERFSGEVPPRLLFQPDEKDGRYDHKAIRWDLIRYDAVLRLIEKELERRDTWQGKKYPS